MNMYSVCTGDSVQQPPLLRRFPSRFLSFDLFFAASALHGTLQPSAVGRPSRRSGGAICQEDADQEKVNLDFLRNPTNPLIYVRSKIHDRNLPDSNE